MRHIFTMGQKLKQYGGGCAAIGFLAMSIRQYGLLPEYSGMLVILAIGFILIGGSLMVAGYVCKDFEK